MKVFFSPSTFTKEYYHLLVSNRWEKDDGPWNEMVVMRAQFFCEDVGRIHHKHEKYRIEPYDREKHLKKLCPKCVLKAKKSKRHEPSIRPS